MAGEERIDPIRRLRPLSVISPNGDDFIAFDFEGTFNFNVFRTFKLNLLTYFCLYICFYLV